MLVHDVVVLEPDAALERGGVNTRLKRNHIPNFKDVIRTGNDPRRFVAVVPDAVPGVMPEAFFVSSCESRKSLIAR